MKQFPDTIKKGDSLNLDIESAEYNDTDGFSVVVYITGPSGSPVPYNFSTTLKTGTSNIYELRVLPTVTNGFQKGLFTYAFVATDGTDQHTFEEGTFQVEERADFLTTTDFRSHNQIVLDNIKSVIEGRATQDQKSYTINGRTLERMAISDLLELKKYYEDLVKQEQGRSRNKLKTRMGIDGRGAGGSSSITGGGYRGG